MAKRGRYRIPDFELDDPSCLDDVDVADYPFTAHFSVRKSATACVRTMLERHPQLLHDHYHGRLLLHTAVQLPIPDQERRLQTLRVLLEAGADPNGRHQIEPYHTPLTLLIRETERATPAPLEQAIQYRHKWQALCGHALIDAGADASSLPDVHPLRIYWQQRLRAIARAKHARIATWVALHQRLQSRDVVRVVLRALVVHGWMGWHMFPHLRVKLNPK